MRIQTLIAIKMIFLLTIITGLVYPLVVTGLSQIFFLKRANGSLIEQEGIIIGSELIGQKFDSSAYFWSRPSAIDYNPLPSGGSNLGPTSEKLKMLVDKRKALFDSANLITNAEIPSEMVFASASGLDPHISPKAAMLQVERISKARGFNGSQKEQLKVLIEKMTGKPQFGILGEERINVLLLNIELDKI